MCFTYIICINCLWIMFNDKANKYRQTMNRKLMSDVDVIKYEERTMNCPFSVIMVPVLCPSQVQYYDN